MKHLKNQITQDGSSTLFNSKVGEHYHSTFGAIQESKHIFINACLEAMPKSIEMINLLEIGFGTGLNALLAMQWAEKNRRHISYYGIEAFPVELIQLKKLNYPELLSLGKEEFLKLHSKNLNESFVNDYYRHEVCYSELNLVELPEHHFDAVFFDAFSPDAQPEMWTDDIFRKIASSMKKGGILTTYCCKGIVKRAMKSAGFEIEKLPGPPGKWEFLRAYYR